MSEFAPTFQIGQQVRAKHSYAHRLVGGEVYTVTGVLPPLQLVNFTFPEYVIVEDARGQKSGEWYPYRFEAV